MSSPVLEARGLTKEFHAESGLLTRLFGRSAETITAVDDVSLELHQNEVVGIIGESGCGKTTLLRTLAGLYEPTGGELRIGGEPLSTLRSDELDDAYRRISLIFQEPYSSFNPKFTVEEIIEEPLVIQGLPGGRERVEEAMKLARLTPVARYLDQRPGQLSGGEKQRVSIARALVSDPDVILADEPVSMLDVSTQASILNLLSDLVTETDVSILYISHDLSTVTYICEQLHVMYLGRFVESGSTQSVVNDPHHPYTQLLIDAIPVADPDVQRTHARMEGTPDPSIVQTGGCRFRDRCPERMDICETAPQVMDRRNGGTVACHLYDESQEGI